MRFQAERLEWARHVVSNAPKADGGPAAQWANFRLMQRSVTGLLQLALASA
jgi:hypothetical protein